MFRKKIEIDLTRRPLRLCGEKIFSGLPSASHGLPRGSSGFSMVEISLALMVVGVGMLAILGMFPAGLDQNARSINDTHAAMFAREVFGSLHVHAETNWNEIGVSITNTPIASSGNWWIPAVGGFSNYLNNAVRTNIYRHPSNSNVVDHAFRYRITLIANGLIKSAFLRFWPGEFGKTNNPSVYYSEFYQINR